MKNLERDGFLLSLLVAAFLLAVLCTGCTMRVPIPPNGEDAGKIGYIEGRVTYVPNLWIPGSGTEKQK